MNFKDFEEKISYSFRDGGLLKNALTHSSYANEHGCPDNERLEFLGDAVLELSSSNFIFRNREMSEGQMTSLRASIVCEPTLAFCARELGLDDFILLGRGEERTGGRFRDSVISDALEALIGAIYLDGGFEPADRFIRNFILNDIENKRLFFDAKTVLQELTQERFDVLPEYKIIDEAGPDHRKKFKAAVLVLGEKVGEGSGNTKKSAQQHAAYNALLYYRDNG